MTVAEVLTLLKNSGIGETVAAGIQWVGALLPGLTVFVVLGLLAAAALGWYGLLERIVRLVDAVNEWVGRTVAWLTLGTVLICFSVVVLRYAFETGWVWMQELYVWQHAAVFTIGAGYTFLKGGHVRVDLFYGRMDARGKAWVDLFGTVVFLLPWLVVLLASSTPFLSSSWSIYEWSAEADGMAGYFILKSAIWLFAFLVGAQGLALMCRSLLTLSGRGDDAPATPAG